MRRSAHARGSRAIMAKSLEHTKYNAPHIVLLQDVSISIIHCEKLRQSAHARGSRAIMAKSLEHTYRFPRTPHADPCPRSARNG
eukprot:5815605-Pyramimonas_sp.AAC.1